MENQEYRNKKSASYSLLAKLSIHPIFAYEMLTQPERETEFFSIGNYVDEGIHSNPRDNFYVIEDNIIPQADSKAAEIAEQILMVITDEELSQDKIDNLILSSADIIGYYPNWKQETRLEKLRPLVGNYIKIVSEARRLNKSIITVSQQELAEVLISSIKESKRFNSIIDGCALLYQKSIYFVKENVECKALPDIIAIDEANKRIRIIDIKTCNGDFMSNYYSYRYFYQGAFYSEALRNEFGPDYTILNPVFVAADKTLKFPVRVLEQIDWKELWSKDDYFIMNGRRYKTLPRLLKEYEYHVNSDDWSEAYDAVMYNTEKIYL